MPGRMTVEVNTDETARVVFSGFTTYVRVLPEPEMKGPDGEDLYRIEADDHLTGKNNWLEYLSSFAEAVAAAQVHMIQLAEEHGIDTGSLLERYTA